MKTVTQKTVSFVVAASALFKVRGKGAFDQGCKKRGRQMTGGIFPFSRGHMTWIRAVNSGAL